MFAHGILTLLLILTIYRLFIIPAEPGSRPQQIGYLNVMPACSDPGGMFSAPVFEGFGETIIKFNQMLRQRPLPGSVLHAYTTIMSPIRRSKHIVLRDRHGSGMKYM